MGDWHQAEEHAERAELLLARGRGAEAEAEIRRAIEIDPVRGEWHAALAMVLESVDRLEEALASMRQAAVLLPDDVLPITSAAELSLRLDRPAEALEHAERAIEFPEAEEQVHAVRIAALHQLERIEDAEVAYFEAPQKLKEMPSCLVAMGDLKAEQNAFDRASWCYREAMRQAPSMPRLRSRIASILGATGKPERALQLHMAELREDPASIESLLACGRLLVGMRRHPEAVDRFRRVLEIEPAHLAAHWELGLTALSLGRFDEARVEFEISRRLDPDMPFIRRRLAEALLGCGEPQRARAQLEEAVDRLQPTEPFEETFHLADLLLEVESTPKALPLFERLAIEHPEDLQVLRRLAVCRYRLGDTAGGIAISRRVLRHEPTCIRSMHNLSVAAMEEGRFMSAFIWAKRGLAEQPLDPGLRRLRSRLWTRLALTWSLGLPRLAGAVFARGLKRIRSRRQHPTV